MCTVFAPVRVTICARSSSSGSVTVRMPMVIGSDIATGSAPRLI